MCCKLITITSKICLASSKLKRNLYYRILAEIACQHAPHSVIFHFTFAEGREPSISTKGISSGGGGSSSAVAAQEEKYGIGKEKKRENVWEKERKKKLPIKMEEKEIIANGKNIGKKGL